TRRRTTPRGGKSPFEPGQFARRRRTPIVRLRDTSRTPFQVGRVMTTTNRSKEEPAMPYLYVSEIARRCGVRPRDISDLFYTRALDDQVCPVVGGRRLIPEYYVPVVEAVLRARGKTGAEQCQVPREG